MLPGQLPSPSASKDAEKNASGDCTTPHSPKEQQSLSTVVPALKSQKTWLPQTDTEKQERLSYYVQLTETLAAQKEEDRAPAPQRVKSKGTWQDVYPHRWGITMAQCKTLMQIVRHDTTTHPAGWSTDYNVEDLVKYYIKPWTLNTGMGYSLLVNVDDPKEVNVMVSHAWKENCDEFFASLERTVKPTDVMYICFLANYQHNDGYGPTIPQQLGHKAADSPFRKVLDHIGERGIAAGFAWKFQRVIQLIPVLFLVAALVCFSLPLIFHHCVPTFDSCARLIPAEHTVDTWVYEPLEPLYKACLPLSLSALLAALICHTLLHALRTYDGRMVAVPCRECDVYGRLWCVYEIFCATTLGISVELAKTLAGAGTSLVSVSMTLHNLTVSEFLADSDQQSSVKNKIAEILAANGGSELQSNHPRGRWPMWEVSFSSLSDRSVSVSVLLGCPGDVSDTVVKSRLRSCRSLEQELQGALAGLLANLQVKLGQVTLQRGGSPTMRAACGSPEDRDRIHREIAECGGAGKVDDAIALTTRSHWISITITACLAAIALSLLINILVSLHLDIYVIPFFELFTIPLTGDRIDIDQSDLVGLGLGLSFMILSLIPLLGRAIIPTRGRLELGVATCVMLAGGLLSNALAAVIYVLTSDVNFIVAFALGLGIGWLVLAIAAPLVVSFISSCLGQRIWLIFLPVVLLQLLISLVVLVARPLLADRPGDIYPDFMRFGLGFLLVYLILWILLIYFVRGHAVELGYNVFSLCKSKPSRVQPVSTQSAVVLPLQPANTQSAVVVQVRPSGTPSDAALKLRPFDAQAEETLELQPSSLQPLEKGEAPPPSTLDARPEIPCNDLPDV